MQVQDIVRTVDGEVVAAAGSLAGREVVECFAADLMSDVLAFARPGGLLVTGLATLQSIHAADVADLSAVLYVAGKKPPAAVVEMAEQRKIPLLVTPHPMFEVCGRLHAAGLPAGSSR